MKNKTKKRPKSLRAMTVRLAAGTLAVWLVCMAVMTLAVAQMLFDALLKASSELVTEDSFYRVYLTDENEIWERDEETPGFLDYNLLQLIHNHNGRNIWRDSRWYIGEESMGGLGDMLLPLRDERVPMDVAILVTDGEGNLLHENRDFLYFRYGTQESWDAAGDTYTKGCGWIDLGDETDERYTFFRELYGERRSLVFEVENLRITGFWAGNRMEPVKMDYISMDMRDDALKNDGPDKAYYEEDGTFVQEYSSSVKDLIKRGYLSWAPIFDNSGEVKNAEELVTIYVSHPEMSVYADESGAVVWDQPEYWSRYAELHGLTAVETKNGVKYENLKALLKDITAATAGKSWGNVCFYRCGLDEIIVLDQLRFHDTRNYDWSSALEYPAAKIIMTTAVRSTPLRSAVTLLRNVYIGTFLLALIVFRWMRNQFRDHLVQPVTEVNRAMRENYQYPHYYQDFDPDWDGGCELIENYKEMREQLRMRSNEITRLETALDYAQRAEAKRRQMTSNIAHELKTPLAVVHSYAEGLQEHIAEEKREQYLQTILSETERMDTMVLEMLDLSRLEAGKVKLARDEFDLVALAKSVFDTLTLKSEEKGLQMSLELDEPVMVSADEGRIRQVIENYASNAVKYTPEGGRISVRIEAGLVKTTFLVENESAPLPPEALANIWDSFYRVDDSRTGRSGTGLGLAIAKSIVELHGGSVDVRNTKTGVEFRFTI